MCTEIYEKFVYKYSETIKYVKQPTFYKIFRVLFLYEHKRIARYSNITLSFLYKQTVYKQLALGWQIAQQLSGLIPLSLSNNKKYGSRKMEFFLCSKRKIVVKLTMYQNSLVSKALLGKF